MFFNMPAYITISFLNTHMFFNMPAYITFYFSFKYPYQNKPVKKKAVI